MVFLCCQKMYPDPRTYIHLFNFFGQLTHRWKLGIAVVPGSSVACSSSFYLPAIINHHEWTIGSLGCKTGYKCSIVTDIFCAVVAIVAIPVIESIDGLFGQYGIWTHLFTEQSGGCE